MMLLNTLRANLEQIQIEDQSVFYPELTVHSVYKRFQKALRAFTSKSREYSRLRGKYILLGDGLWFSFDEQDWVLYILLLKPRRRNYAYLLEPLILPGKESYDNWKKAIDTIPERIRNRILAFVSDDFRASDKVAKHYGWHHQLCHFHLISQLQKRRGRRKKNIPGRSIREDIYQHVRTLLKTDDEKNLKVKIKELESLAEDPRCPKKMGMISREFLRKIEKYRAYLNHRSYTIPRTTSPVESVGKLIRKRTAVLTSPESVQQWATAFMRLRKKIVCNGCSKSKNQQN